jgi:Flp pilus assembly protein TadD
MLTRLLLFAGLVAPLYAQDEDVTKYLEELRAPKPPRDVEADQRALLSALRQQLDTTTDRAQKATVYLRISGIEQELREPDAAIAAARNARDLEPADNRIALGLATVLTQNGQTAEVPALLGVDPTDGAALVAKALLLDSPPVATYLAELARQLLPGDPKVADTVGQIYMRSGDVSHAMDAFLQAEDLAPRVAAYHYHMGLAIVQSGRRDYAKSELQLALESNPTDSERANIENTLARIDAPFKKH